MQERWISSSLNASAIFANADVFFRISAIAVSIFSAVICEIIMMLQKSKRSPKVFLADRWIGVSAAYQAAGDGTVFHKKTNGDNSIDGSIHLSYQAR